MADEILIFDAAASNADGTDPGSPLTVGPATSYQLEEMSFPAPPMTPQYSSSVDTEGEVPVARKFGNRTVTLRFGLNPDATDALLKALQVKFAKLQREGGTLKRTMKNGDVRIYDILAADGWDPVFDLGYYLGDITTVTMSLPAKPFARGVEVAYGYISDDFATNTIANYTAHTGGGTIAVSGGQLVPSTTATKILTHAATGQTFEDARVTLKITTGTATTNVDHMVVAKFLDVNNFLAARIHGSGALQVGKFDAGAYTSLASIGATLGASSARWLRLIVQDNVMTGEWWTAAPVPGGAPAFTISYTLTAGDATKFGTGVLGNVGMRLTPHATDERYDDFVAGAFFDVTGPALSMVVS